MVQYNLEAFPRLYPVWIQGSFVSLHHGWVGCVRSIGPRGLTLSPSCNVLQNDVGTQPLYIFHRSTAGETKAAGSIVERDDCIPLLNCKRLRGIQIQPYRLTLSVEGIIIDQRDHAEGRVWRVVPKSMEIALCELRSTLRPGNTIMHGMRFMGT